MEEEARPLPEEVSEAASLPRAEAQGSDPFTSLIAELHVQEHKRLSLPEISKVYDMLVNLGSETAGNITPQVHETIRSVSIGFGFLSFDQLPDGKKVAFIQRLRRDEKYHSRDHLTLTPAQAEILQRVAMAVNISYDPGKAEEETKRIFAYSDFVNRVPEGYELHNP